MHRTLRTVRDWDEAGATAVIDRFLKRDRSRLSEDEIAYIEFCRDGFHA